MLRPLRALRIVLLSLAAMVAALSSASAHEPAAVPIADLTRRIAASPDSLPLYLARGELRRIVSDFTGALADYAQVARLDSRHPRLAVCRAALALDTGDPAGARRWLDEALASHPADADALGLRARALAALGERRAAIADLGAAITLLDRPSPDLYLQRARLEVAEGDRAAARSGLEEARSRIGAAASLGMYAIELDLEDGLLEDAGARLGDLEAHSDDRSALAGLEARIAAAGGRGVPRLAGTSAPGSAQAGGTRSVAPSPATPARDEGNPAGVAVIARHGEWEYDATGTDLGTLWRQPGYVDSAWAGGPGALGYGEPYLASVVPAGPGPLSHYPTTYFRIHFEMPNPLPPILTLTMTAEYDDGIVVYLNGLEAARRSISSGTVGNGTWALSHEAGTYESVDLSGARSALVPGTNVLAVEVHQASADSPDLVWDADLAYSNLPRVTRGPYLQMGTDSAVTVRWRTSTATDGRVVFGASPEVLDLGVPDATVSTEHEARITGLTPATRYFYAVGTSTDVLAGGDSSFTFRTAPPDAIAAPVRVWIVGDSGVPGPIAYSVRDAYTEWNGSHETSLWLMLGDNAYSTGTDSEYQSAVFDQYPSLLRRCVLWPTRGNHDALHGGPNNDYYDMFTMPSAAEAGGMLSGTEAYYSFDWSNIHFICLDSEGSDHSPGGAMLTWLAGDLAANVRPWVIAYWHHPPYSKGSHDSDTESALAGMRQYALPVLEAGGVDLVLCGHSHSYERSFLLDGHYGVSSTLTPAMIVDGGDGRPGGDGGYQKPINAPFPHEGAVYAVSGSGAHVSGGPLNHPVMVASLNLAGSMVLDVQGNQLEARFLTETGAVMDSFSIVKSLPAGVGPGAAPGMRLGPALPNPFARDLSLSYVLDRPGRVRLSVCDASGRRLAIVEEGWREAGAHEARWDGRDRNGEGMPSGVYLAVLEAHGRRVSRKIAHLR